MQSQAKPCPMLAMPLRESNGENVPPRAQLSAVEAVDGMLKERMKLRKQLADVTAALAKEKEDRAKCTDEARQDRARFRRDLEERDEAAAHAEIAAQAALDTEREQSKAAAAEDKANFRARLRERDDEARQAELDGQAAWEAERKQLKAAAAEDKTRFQIRLQEHDDARKQAEAAFEAERTQLKSAQAAFEVEEAARHRAQLQERDDAAKRAELAVQAALADANATVAKEREASAKCTAEAMTQQAQLDAARAQLEAVQKAKAALAAEGLTLQSQLVSANTSIEQLQQSHAALTESTATTGSQLAQAMTQLSDLRKELEGAQSAAAAQAADAAALQAQLTAAEAEVGEALAVADTESGEKASLADRVRDLRAQLGASTSSNEALRSELAKERQDRQTETQGWHETLEKQKRVAEGLDQEKRSLEVEFRSFKEHHGSDPDKVSETMSALQVQVEKLGHQYEKSQVELGILRTSVSEKESHIMSLMRHVAQGETHRRELHNEIQNLKGNIRVMCRVRPSPVGEESAVQVPEPGRVKILHGTEQHAWNFDKVFGTKSSQENVFTEVEGLVQSALDGYKVCLFAYGQTGSGKTFTMQGPTDPQLWGLIPRSLSKVFQEASDMETRGWTWTLEASFLEVYNETLRDLLRDGKAADPGAPLAIQHSDEWGSVVVNAITVPVDSMQQVSDLMAKAARQRAVGYTDQNATSSRSHSMFALYLKGVNKAKNEQLHGALHLVDLAGSERLGKSGAEGDRLRETQNINKSLSCLTDVFVAKAEKHKHVPFRNSKLTHLMEPCLSGEGKTLMFVNVGPEATNSHESLCSLRFAARVSQCNTGDKPKRGVTALSSSSSGASSSAATATPGAASSSSSAARPRSAMTTASTASRTRPGAGWR